MADEQFNISSDLKGLNQLLKALTERAPECKIGVLGSDSRKDGLSNAEIGMKHEFGSIGEGLPQRSFLRVPISENMQKKIDNTNLFTEDKSKEIIKHKSVKPWLEILGNLAVSCSLDAFESSGSGKWAPWTDPNYHNATGKLLVDTGQLKDSIKSEVKE